MNTRTSGFFTSTTNTFIFLLLPATLIYIKSLKFDFTTLDEQWMIVENGQYLASKDVLQECFTKPLAEIYYRPLFSLSILLNYNLGQLSPFIYHLNNLLFHLLSVLLIFKFLNINAVERKTAAILSVLFSVHPLFVHAVSWIPGRNDLMLCLFSLSSLIYLHKFIQQGKWKHLAAHLLLYTFALFTKETAIALSLVFAVYYFIHKGFNRKEVSLLFLLWCIISAGWLFLRNRVVSHIPQSEFNSSEVILNTIKGIFLYTGKLIFPFQQSILPSTKHSSIIPGLITLLFILLAFTKPGIRNIRLALFGLLLFTSLLIIPIWFSSMRSNGEHYEHRAYTSVVGLLLFLSQLKINFDTKPMTYLLSVIFLIYCLKTNARMSVYKNKFTFLERAVEERPDFYLFHCQMGGIYLDEQQYAKSVECYSQAIRLRPDFPKLYSGRGTAYYYYGRYAEAIADYTKAIQKSEKFEEKYLLNRCIAYLRYDDIKNAMKDMIPLIKCCHGIIPSAAEKEITEKWFALLHDLDEKVDSDPTNADFLHERAKLFADIEEIERAEEDIKNALLRDSTNKEYRTTFDRINMIKKTN